MLEKRRRGDRTEATVGDKSPKSKQRGEKQKVAAESRDAAAAKSKQEGNSRAVKAELPGQKRKK